MPVRGWIPQAVLRRCERWDSAAAAGPMCGAGRCRGVRLFGVGAGWCDVQVQQPRRVSDASALRLDWAAGPRACEGVTRSAFPGGLTCGPRAPRPSQCSVCLPVVSCSFQDWDLAGAGSAGLSLRVSGTAFCSGLWSGVFWSSVGRGLMGRAGCRSQESFFGQRGFGVRSVDKLLCWKRPAADKHQRVYENVSVPWFLQLYSCFVFGSLSRWCEHLRKKSSADGREVEENSLLRRSGPVAASRKRVQ